MTDAHGTQEPAALAQRLVEMSADQGSWLLPSERVVLREAAAALTAPSTLDVEAIRANLHATFNGGWHEEEPRRAFHHGMDTVCNVLESYQKGEQTNGIFPRRAAPAPRVAEPHPSWGKCELCDGNDSECDECLGTGRADNAQVELRRRLQESAAYRKPELRAVLVAAQTGE